MSQRLRALLCVLTFERSPCAWAGHYTAYCRNEATGEGASAKWVYCNDHHVSEVAPQRVVSELAYCLFYKRRHVQPHNAVNLSTAPP